jgi:hypothetical protein
MTIRRIGPPMQRLPWVSVSTPHILKSFLAALQKMRIFETEYPQMKYLTNLFSISMLKILFWVIIVNLIAKFETKVL